ncbi:MAG TPA: hypothetical protein VIO11_06545 [Candidatus Methanoperedens sp.]
MVYVKIKKWGNSFVIALPLKRLFGTLNRKMSAQKIKDEIRAGWEE